MLRAILVISLTQTVQPVKIVNPSNQSQGLGDTAHPVSVTCVSGCNGAGGSGGSSGGPVDQGLSNDGGTSWHVDVVTSTLPTGASTSAKQDTGNTSLSSIDGKVATETTLALIKAKTDNIDVALSTRTKPADQQHVIVDSSATVAVTGTVTANAGTNLNTSLLALDSTLTGGTQKAIARGGAKGATTAADVTSTANGADHQGLDVQVQNASIAVTGTVTANAGSNLNTSALALSATQTDRTQKAQITDGTRDGTVKAASTAAQAADTSLVVALSPNSPIPAGTAVIGHVIADTGSTTAVTGNVTVVQGTGTNLHVVSDSTSTTAVTQATASNLNAQVVGAAASGAAKAGNPVQVGGVFNTTQPTVTNGQAVETQATARGATIVAPGVDNTATNAWFAKVTDGTTTAAVIAGTTALKTDMSSVAGTATSTAAAGVLKVGIVGGTNTSLETTAGVLDLNLKNVNNAAVTTGNGTASGSIRVSVASDSTGTIAATQSGTWSDRVVGNAGGAIDAANNGTAPANVWVAGYQLQSGATATAGTAGQVGSPVASLDHVPYARLGGPVTWACSLDNLGATLTQCQAVGGAGLKYYITDIEIESTTTTAGLFLVRYGTGTNCGTGTTSLFPSAATVARMSYPASNAANPSVFHFLTPLVTAAAQEICIICTATNTCSVQMTGYTAP